MPTKKKVWTGKLTREAETSISAPEGRWSSGFRGAVVVYAFQPDDPRCKVRFIALVRGVRTETLCSNSGAVGAAILKAAHITSFAKNAPISADYDVYPDPVGCPAQRLADHDEVAALLFYGRTR